MDQMVSGGYAHTTDQPNLLDAVEKLAAASDAIQHLVAGGSLAEGLFRSGMIIGLGLRTSIGSPS